MNHPYLPALQHCRRGTHSLKPLLLLPAAGLALACASCSDSPSPKPPPVPVTIMEARMNLLLAFGLSKAQAVAEAVEGPVTSINPASVLQLHPVVKVCLDDAAACQLLRADYFRLVYDNKPDWQKLFIVFFFSMDYIHHAFLSIKGLTLNDEPRKFYF